MSSYSNSDGLHWPGASIPTEFSFEQAQSIDLFLDVFQTGRNMQTPQASLFVVGGQNSSTRYQMLKLIVFLTKSTTQGKENNVKHTPFRLTTPVRSPMSQSKV
jgi:hypothetical protein